MAINWFGVVVGNVRVASADIPKADIGYLSAEFVNRVYPSADFEWVVACCYGVPVPISTGK